MVNLKQLNPKKILVINTFGIGDVLFTTPFVSNLKANFPDAIIAYLGNRRTASLLEDNIHIDKVFIYERDEYNAVYKESKIKFLKKLKSGLDEIKNEQFEVVFDFSLNRSINLLTKIAGIKYRIGFNFKNRSPYLTDSVSFEGFEAKHVAQHYLDLLTPLGLDTYDTELQMPISDEDQKWADQYLADQNINRSTKLIGVIPGAGESWGKEARYRRWSTDKYAELVDKLIEKFSVKIILMGAKHELELCEKVKKSDKKGIIEACGKTTIGQLAALLTKCNLVVLNDGGPLHIAVAAKAKTVSIFGPVDEHVYGPFGMPQNHVVAKKNLACQPCYRRFRMTNCDHISCLETLEVDDVLKKIEKIL